MAELITVYSHHLRESKEISHRPAFHGGKSWKNRHRIHDAAATHGTT